MRVLHLSTYDLMGGAAKAALRLHTALVEDGVDSSMLVRRKESARGDVFGPRGWLRRTWSRGQRRAEDLRLMRAVRGEFSVGDLPDGLRRGILELRPDLLHLHWVSNGFLRLETLAALGLPVVWTMHDMWAFTGGCHYSGDCSRYQSGCGHCPMLSKPGDDDLSSRGARRRLELANSFSAKFVAPSRWMADCALASRVLKRADVRVIPNTLDTRRFAPRDQAGARGRAGLPVEGKCVLVGGMDLRLAGVRKGTDTVNRVIERLAAGKKVNECIYLVVFGTREKRVVEHAGLPVFEMGNVASEDAMADIYAAADVFLAPSRQDNLPNTVMESMAVGTPVVAYAVGGIPDMIDDGINGRLAPPGDVDALFLALVSLLGKPVKCRESGRQARLKVERCYAPKVVAAAYRNVYAESVGQA